MSDSRRPYPSDPSDAEWTLLAPLLPPPRPTGRPRKWPDRFIADAICYVLRSGCAWRMLPREFPPWSTVLSRFRRRRLDGTLRRAHEVLRALVRQRAGRAAEPTAAVIDSQSERIRSRDVDLRPPLAQAITPSSQHRRARADCGATARRSSRRRAPSPRE
ncbi:MAG TPA: transposase, partial [Gemmatimonadaceae bacterium]|nr:transposase [Gemmatimonadaceae bacterium]